jgi:hypothetical protein
MLLAMRLIAVYLSCGRVESSGSARQTPAVLLCNASERQLLSSSGATEAESHPAGMRTRPHANPKTKKP